MCEVFGAKVVGHMPVVAAELDRSLDVGFPVVLLVTSDARHAHVAVATVAGYSVFGLTMTAFNTHGVRLVAARESGILKRWRATPLPRWCYFLGRIVATVVVAPLSVP